jgi:glycosyltransferase involved in cell wall biosynthesis
MWSYVPVEPDADLLHRALTGDLKLVAWGTPTDVALFQWRTGLRFAYVVDTTWRLWGDRVLGLTVRSPEAIETEDRETTAVVCFFYKTPTFPRVIEFLARRKMPWLLPLPLLEMGRLMRARGATAGPPPLARVLELADTLPSRSAEERHLADLLARARASAPRRPPVPGRVDLLLSALFAGGAERQICNLALGLQRLGWSPRVVSLEPVPVEAAHYEGFLFRHDIPHVVMDPFGTDADAIAAGMADPAVLPPPLGELLRLLEPAVAIRVAQVYRATVQAPPELLVCYLDWANTAGALGGLVAGIPRILPSGRNLAPRHFMHFYGAALDSFHLIYRLLLGAPEVVLACNSRAGAADYADWLGVPPDAIPEIPNTIDVETAALPPVDAGAAPPHVLGVFRLAPEKRPDLFVEVIDRLRHRVPGLRATICGDGSERTRIAELIRERGLQAALSLAGVVSDVPAMMARHALLLHVAAQEGMPNAILEAEALGLPVVTTDAGGTREVLAPAQRPYLHAPDDVDGLEASCLALLGDPALRRRVGAQSRAETLERFSLDALTAGTLAAVGLPPQIRRSS